MATTSEMHLGKPGGGEGYRFDYRGMHRYYIALPTFKARPLFLQQALIRPVLDALHGACLQHHFDIYAYCFLPERLVMIARGKSDQSDMKAFLSSFRAASSVVAEPALGHPLWRRKYLERVLRKTENTADAAAEIFSLPVKAGLVPQGSHYEFQGSFVKPGRETP